MAKLHYSSLLWRRHLCGEVFWVKRRLIFNYVPPTPGTVGAADTVMSNPEQVLTSWRLPAGAETDKSQLDRDWRCEVNERRGELWVEGGGASLGEIE